MRKILKAKIFFPSESITYITGYFNDAFATIVNKEDE